MKVVLTAFEPFGGELVNPSLEALERINDHIDGAEIIKVKVPVVFGKAIDVVLAAMHQEKPDVVLCLGQAGGRTEISLERVAININDASIADNESVQPIDQTIYQDGEPAYFATIPIKAITGSINRSGIKAGVSNSAGTYVCNNLLYGILHHMKHEFPGMRGGFMHVPYIPEQVVGKSGIFSMPLDDIVKAIEIAIQAIVGESV